MTGILIKGGRATDPKRLRAWELFKTATLKVWANGAAALYNADAERGYISDLTSACTSELACIIYAGRPWEAGDRLIFIPHEFELRVTDKLLKRSDDDIYKVMVHEAVHLGVHGHNERFRTICRKHGGVVNAAALDDPGIHVEKKIGSRYVRVKTFDDERAAAAWVRDQQREDMHKLVIEAQTGATPIEELRKRKPKYRFALNGLGCAGCCCR